MKREKGGKKYLNVGLAMNMVIKHLSVLKERKSIMEITNLEEIDYWYANEENDFDEQVVSASDDKIIYILYQRFHKGDIS